MIVDVNRLETFIEKGASRSVAKSFKKDMSALSVAVRSRHNLSQRELADMLGVRQATVSRWEVESSVPNVWVAKRLLNLLKENEMMKIKKPVLRTHRPKVSGLNLRDKFAMAAMQGLCAQAEWPPMMLAETSYEYADAMIKARGGSDE
jgi:DNA-binding transcriptional regulator YiaG